MSNEIIDWDSVNSDTEELSFENQSFQSKIVSVYDGDTIKCVFPLNGKMYKWNCRINGIDTPEIRTRSALEKEAGYKARDFLREKILNKIVTVHCGDFDKYGRLLVNVEVDNKDMSELLVELGLAFKYDGGTRRNWDDYLKSKLDNST